MSQPRYIRVSEVNSYLFCKRAWYLDQRGAESVLAERRAEGTTYHRRHGEEVQSARTATRFANYLALVRIALLVLFLSLVLR